VGDISVAWTREESRVFAGSWQAAEGAWTMNRRTKWMIAVGALALVAVLAYSTFQQSRYRYEVCVSFHGRSHCATAAGRTPEEAMRSAHEIDCTLLAGSREENMACLDTAPASSRPLGSP
jgi:hypothetical protein